MSLSKPLYPLLSAGSTHRHKLVDDNKSQLHVIYEFVLLPHVVALYFAFFVLETHKQVLWQTVTLMKCCIMCKYCSISSGSALVAKINLKNFIIWKFLTHGYVFSGLIQDSEADFQ